MGSVSQRCDPVRDTTYQTPYPPAHAPRPALNMCQQRGPLFALADMATFGSLNPPPSLPRARRTRPWVPILRLLFQILLLLLPLSLFLPLTTEAHLALGSVSQKYDPVRDKTYQTPYQPALAPRPALNVYQQGRPLSALADIADFGALNPPPF